MTISEIKQHFALLPIEHIPNSIEKYKSDSRIGVQNICKQYGRKYEKHFKDATRIENMRGFDQVFGNNGKYSIAGIDEAGRGPLAGPVVAAAVVLPFDLVIDGIDDSKKLNEEQRNILYDKIMNEAISVGIGIVNASVIDNINILQATFRAMKKAIFSLTQCPKIVLVDGHQIVPEISSNIIQHAVIQGDSKSISIAAASIIAKVTRDRIMLDYDKIYPEYGFPSNKGYGSPLHQRAIQEFGPSPIHRRSFLGNILGPWD